MVTMPANRPTVLVKVREAQNQKERDDKRDFRRVIFATENLLALNLKPGQLIYLAKAGEDNASRIPAIAWNTTVKLSKDVAVFFKNFKEMCGFKLGDELVVESGGDVPVADTIVLKDISNVDMKERDIPCWEWGLEDSLLRCETIFSGQIVTCFLVRPPKRTFQVMYAVGRSSGTQVETARFDEQSKVIIASGSDAPQTRTTSKRLQIDGVAGLDSAIRDLNDFLERFQEDYVPDSEELQEDRTCAILLSGVPGIGKSMILDKLRDSKWGTVFEVTPSTQPSSLQQVFKDAWKSQPSIIIIDKLETLVSGDDKESMAFANALVRELNNLAQMSQGKLVPNPPVLVAAATAKPLAIPQDLRYRGRFTKEIMLPIPDADARGAILQSFSGENRHASTTLLRGLAEETHAYTGANLETLWHEAGHYRMLRIRNLERSGAEVSPEARQLTKADFDEALLRVRPSAMNDITLRPRTVHWDEIGGSSEIKRVLLNAMGPPKNEAHIKRLGITPRTGILLYGPPGCSKTMLAAAVATSVSYNFLAVKGAELLNMYVGESERALRAVFQRARAAAPAIIFFDEFESIAEMRAGSGGDVKEKGANGGVNTVTTLLNEMDGIESLEGVKVLAATNLPWVLDSAVLRPGRFDEVVYVGLPDEAARLEILQLRLRESDVAPEVREKVEVPAGTLIPAKSYESGLHEIAAKTEGYTGADVVSVVMTALQYVVYRIYDTGREEKLGMADLRKAVEANPRTVTPEQHKRYLDWGKGRSFWRG